MDIRQIANMTFDAEGQTEPSDYTQNVNPSEWSRDPRVLADMRSLASMEGKAGLTDDELVDWYSTRMRWSSVNTVSAADRFVDTQFAPDAKKEVEARLRRVWQASPMPWNEGGTGTVDAVVDYGLAGIFDPVNLIPVGGSLEKGAMAARAAYLAGKSASEAGMAGVKAGVVRGALSEAAINAGQSAAVGLAEQGTEVELGMRPGIDKSELLTQAGMDAGLGAIFGGVVGAPAGLMGARRVVGEVDALSPSFDAKQMGAMTPEEMSRNARFVQSGQQGPMTSSALAEEGQQAAAARAAAEAEAVRASQIADAAVKSGDLDIQWEASRAAINNAYEAYKQQLDRLRLDRQHELPVDDPGRQFYNMVENDLQQIRQLDEIIANVENEKEQIKALEGSNTPKAAEEAAKRRRILEQRMSDARNAVLQYADKESTDAAIASRLEQLRQRATAQKAEAEAANAEPVKTKGQKPAQQQNAAPQQQAETPAAEKTAEQIVQETMDALRPMQQQAEELMRQAGAPQQQGAPATAAPQAEVPAQTAAPAATPAAPITPARERFPLTDKMREKLAKNGLTEDDLFNYIDSGQNPTPPTKVREVSTAFINEAANYKKSLEAANQTPAGKAETPVDAGEAAPAAANATAPKAQETELPVEAGVSGKKQTAKERELNAYSAETKQLMAELGVDIEEIRNFVSTGQSKTFDPAQGRVTKRLIREVAKAKVNGSVPDVPVDVNTQTTALDFGPAIWKSKDFDYPVEVFSDAPVKSTQDGRMYRRVRNSQDGTVTYVPEDELVSDPSRPKVDPGIPENKKNRDAKSLLSGKDSYATTARKELQDALDLRPQWFEAFDGDEELIREVLENYLNSSDTKTNVADLMKLYDHVIEGYDKGAPADSGRNMADMAALGDDSELRKVRRLAAELMAGGLSQEDAFARANEYVRTNETVVETSAPDPEFKRANTRMASGNSLERASIYTTAGRGASGDKLQAFLKKSLATSTIDRNDVEEYWRSADLTKNYVERGVISAGLEKGEVKNLIKQNFPLSEASKLANDNRAAIEARRKAGKKAGDDKARAIQLVFDMLGFKESAVDTGTLYDDMISAKKEMLDAVAARDPITKQRAVFEKALETINATEQLIAQINERLSQKRVKGGRKAIELQKKQLEEQLKTIYAGMSKAEIVAKVEELRFADEAARVVEDSARSSFKRSDEAVTSAVRAKEAKNKERITKVAENVYEAIKINVHPDNLVETKSPKNKLTKNEAFKQKEPREKNSAIAARFGLLDVALQRSGAVFLKNILERHQNWATVDSATRASYPTREAAIEDIKKAIKEAEQEVNKIAAALSKAANQENKLEALPAGPTIVPYKVANAGTRLADGSKATYGQTVWYSAWSGKSYASLEEAAYSARMSVADDSNIKKMLTRQALDAFKRNGDKAEFQKNLKAILDGELVQPKLLPTGKLVMGNTEMFMVLARKSDLEALARGEKVQVDIRKMSKQRADSGISPEQSLIKGSKIDEWEVRYTTDPSDPTSPAQRLKIWNAATPIEKVDPTASSRIRAQQGAPEFWKIARNPVNELSDAEARVLAAISRGSTSADDIKARAKSGQITVKDILTAINNLHYRFPVPKTANGFKAYIDAMEIMASLEARITPDGYILPNVTREKAQKQIEAIFEGYDANTKAAAQSLLRNLGGDRDIGPRIMQPDQDNLDRGAIGSFVYTPVGEKNAAGEDISNSILLATRGQIESSLSKLTKEKDGVISTVKPGPALARLLHETFHWAFVNVMTAQDRLELLRLLKSELFDASGNLDAAKVKMRLPDLENIFASPNEILANLFSQWAFEKRVPEYAKLRSVMQADVEQPLGMVARLFNKVKDILLATIDRYFAKQPISPAMEMYFSKILPETERLKFQNGRGIEPADGLPRAKYIKKLNERMRQFSTIRNELTDAALAGSDAEVIRAAANFANFLYGVAVNNKRSGAFSKLREFQKLLHSKIKDINYIIDGKLIDDDLIEEQASKIAPDSIVRTDEMYDVEDIEVEGLIKDNTVDMDPVKQGIVADQLRHLINHGYGTSKDGLELSFPYVDPFKTQPQFSSIKYAMRLIEDIFTGEYMSSVGKLPAIAIPKTFTEEFEASAARARTRVDRQQAQAARKSEEVVIHAKDGTTPADAPSGESSLDANGLREMTVDQLAAEYRRTRGTDRGNQILREIKYKLRTAPAPVKRDSFPSEFTRLKVDDLVSEMLDLIYDGNPVAKERVELIEAYVTKRLKDKDSERAAKRAAPKTADMVAAVEREIADYDGLEEIPGIPPKARPGIRELLSFLTHRDPEVAIVQRTLAYRILNLMGKTTRDQLDDVNVMSLDELTRLAGVQASPTATGAVIDFRGEAFKALRNDLRRISVGLIRGTSDAFDVIHEVAHVIARGVMSEQDRAAIVGFFRAADDEVKARIIRAYGPKYGYTPPAPGVTDMSRRAFLRGASALAGSTIAPKIDLAKKAITQPISMVDAVGRVSGITKNIQSIYRAMEDIEELDGSWSNLFDELDGYFKDDTLPLLEDIRMSEFGPQEEHDYINGVLTGTVKRSQNGMDGFVKTADFVEGVDNLTADGVERLMDLEERAASWAQKAKELSTIARAIATGKDVSAKLKKISDKVGGSESQAPAKANAPALSEAEIEARLAEEWFAESITEYMAQRVAKGDIAKAVRERDVTDIRFRGWFSRAIDRAVEFVAYAVNGLIGRNDIKQTFRRLMIYGDLFESPRKSTIYDTYVDTIAIPASKAADYVAESLMRNKAKLENMRAYIAGTLGADRSGDPIFLYHGTTNGAALRKDANPDVVMRASETGVYGQGIYTTLDPNAASSVYAGKPRIEALIRRIEESELDSEVQDDLYDLVNGDLQAIRSRMSEVQAEISAIKSEGLGDAVDEEDFNAMILRENLASAERAHRNLVAREKAIFDTLARHGIVPDNLVLPLVTNIRRVADFRRKATYEAGDAFVVALWSKLNEYVPASLRDSFTAAMPNRRLTGRSLFDAAVKAMGGTARNSADRMIAVEAINSAVRDLDYDGMKLTFTDIVPDDLDEGDVIEHDGFLIFNPGNLKHIDADVFDPDDTRLYYRDLEGVPATPSGSLVNSTIEKGIFDLDDGNMAHMIAAMDRAGVPSTMIDVMQSLYRKRMPDTRTLKSMNRFFTKALGSQSANMRQVGMSWLADKFDDFFPRVTQAFAKDFYPSLDAIRSLPGTANAAGRWVQRSFGTIPGFGKRLSEQPRAYTRVVKAMRYGKDHEAYSVLTTKEKEVFDVLTNKFAEFHRRLKASGESMLGKRENYLPQVWSAERISANREAFVSGLAEYFVFDREANGGRLDPKEARAAAERVAARITDDDADVFFPADIQRSSAQNDNIDYSRVIDLDKYPGFLAKMEGFLEDDLEAIITKYYDGANRRIIQNEMFGNATHGFNDYRKVIEDGADGIADLLSTSKIYSKKIKGVAVGGELTDGRMEMEIPMPFNGNPQDARNFARGLIDIFNNGGGSAGVRKALMELGASFYKNDVNKVISYTRRVEAIIGALEDFKGERGKVPAPDLDRAVESMKLIKRQPLTDAAFGGRAMLNFSRSIRAFNAITLLSFTTLTSIPDLTMPIIRSGEFKGWVSALKNMATDPDYANLMRGIGVAVESEVHHHMSRLYGTEISKHSSAFFNATMLTPWTNTMRKIAAATGYETFKIMQDKAFSNYKAGVDLNGQNAQYKLAHRFLNRYGLQDYLPTGAKNGVSLADRTLLAQDDLVRTAVVKFTDEAIFSPNPNDIPLWAQTPLGAIFFQLKSYPLMMGRMSKWVLQEAAKGNRKPLMYMATLAPMAGAASLAIKDIAQMRGGENNDEAQVRDRNVLKVLGYDEKVHGDKNDFLGWYLEGFMTAGGLGLVGEMIHDVATQVDNGAYGKNRIYSAVFGPSMGTFSSAIDVAGGTVDAFMGNESNAKERAAVREVMRRIPVLGGIGSVREGVTDAVAGESSRATRSTFEDFESFGQ